MLFPPPSRPPSNLADKLCAVLLMLLLGVLLVLVSRLPARSGEARLDPALIACTQHIPLGAPTHNAISDTKILCRIGFVLEHDNARRQPMWVAERLTGTSAWGCGHRINAFRADPDLPEYAQAEVSDYLHSGYDMGHMASAANNLESDEAQHQASLLSNITPQIHTLNAGLWFRIEQMTRIWAAERGKIQVISGPIFGANSATIPNGRIPVPSGFFKVVTDLSTGETLSFLVPHSPLGFSVEPINYVTTVEAVQHATGLHFPRMPGAASLQAIAPWPGNASQQDDLKSQYCSEH